MEPGEKPAKAAVRELYEEAGLKPKELEFLGSETIETKHGPLTVHAFRAEVSGDVSSKNDPDEECSEWRWVDPDNIPDEIMENLHSRKNVTLKLLGLQEWAPGACESCGAEPGCNIDCEECCATERSGKLEKMVYIHDGRINWHGIDPHFYPNGEGRVWTTKPEKVAGYFHHVYTDNTSELKWKDEGRHQKTLHLFSSSPDVADLDAQVMAFHGYVPESDGGYRIGLSRIKPDMQAQGLGTQFYTAVVRHHGKVFSDKDLSPASNRVWEKLVQQPGMTGQLGPQNTPERHSVEIEKDLQKAHDDAAPGNLVAVHNLSEANLQHAQEYAGPRGRVVRAHLANDNPVDLSKTPWSLEESLLGHPGLEGHLGRHGLNVSHFRGMRPWQAFDGELGHRFVSALKDAGYDSASFKEEHTLHDAAPTTHVVFGAEQIHALSDQEAPRRWPASSRVEKSEDLEKAIKDIGPGMKLPEGSSTSDETWDYSHVLPEQHRQAGYTMHVELDRATPGDTSPHSAMMNAMIRHNGKDAGKVEAAVGSHPSGMKTLEVFHSKVKEAHLGRGLGAHAYEALMSHAFHVEGAHMVTGGVHSSMASRAHQKVAQRHGMGYTPVPFTDENYQGPGRHAAMPKRDEWVEKPSGAYDGKWAPYDYTIKDEMPMSKADAAVEPEQKDEIMRLIEHPDPVERSMALKLDGVKAHHLRHALRTAIAHTDSPLLQRTIDHPALNQDVFAEAIDTLPQTQRIFAGLASHRLLDGDLSTRLAKRFITPSTDIDGLWHKPLEHLAENTVVSDEAIEHMAHVLAFWTPISERHRDETDFAPPRSADVKVVNKLLQHPNVSSRTLGAFFQRYVDSPSRLPYNFNATFSGPTGVDGGFRQALMSPKMPVDVISAMAEKALHPVWSGSGVGRAFSMALAHPSLPSKYIDHAISGPVSDTAKKEIAKNPTLSSDHIFKLLDPRQNGSARAMAAKHPNLTKEHIDYALRGGVRAFGDEATGVILEHPSVTTEHVMQVANDDGARLDVRGKAFAHPKMLRHVLEDQFFNKSWAHSIRAKVIANSPHVDKKFLMEAIQRHDGGVNDEKDILAHPAIDEEHLNAAYKSNNPEMRKAAFFSVNGANTPEKRHQMVIESQGDPALAEAVLDSRQNIVRLPQTIAHVIDTTPPEQRYHALSRAIDIKQTPANVLMEAMGLPVVPGDPRGPPGGRALRHPNHTTEHVERAISRGTMYWDAADSPRATPDQLLRILHLDPSTRHLVVRNPNADETVLHMLAQMSSRGESLVPSIVKHPNTGLETLRDLRGKHSLPIARGEQDLIKEIDKRIHRHDPDSFHKEQVVARVGKGNMGKLRAVRDLILEKEPEKKELSPKFLPAGDWSMGRLPNGNISAEKLHEYISSASAQRYNVGRAYWGRGVDSRFQRHSHDQQNVFQLDLTNEHVKKLKEQGLWEHFQKMHEVTMGLHPNGPMTMGWVRWTGGPKVAAITPKDDGTAWAKWAREEEARVQPKIKAVVEKQALHPDEKAKLDEMAQNWEDTLTSLERLKVSKELQAADKHPFIKWVRANVDKKAFSPPKVSGEPGVFVDELQSDWSVSHVKKVAGEARQKAEADFGHLPEDERKKKIDDFVAKKTADANAEWPEDKYRAIMKIAFGDRPPQEVIAEAFMQHLRDKGLHDMKVQWHTPQSKHRQLMALGYLKEGAVPAHMKVGYEDVPKKQGMEPSVYGKLATQKRPNRTDKNKDVANIDSQPTFEGKVRKSEEESFEPEELDWPVVEVGLSHEDALHHEMTRRTV